MSRLTKKQYNFLDILMISSIICILGFLLITSFTPVFAAGGETLSKTANETVVSSICGIIARFFNPCCVLGLAFALMKITLSRDVKSTEDAIRWAKGIIIAFMIFNCLGSFFKFIDGMNLNHTYKVEDKAFSDYVNSQKYK